MCKTFLEAEQRMGFEYGLENKFVYRLASGSAEHLAMWRVSKDGQVRFTWRLSWIAELMN